MSKSKKTTKENDFSKAGKMTKADRRALAIKKAKRNRFIAISIGAAAAVLFFAFVIYSITRPEIEFRVYAASPQSVTLYEDGRFSFVDCRIVRTGMFTEIETDNNDVILEFNHNNSIVRGSISDGVLTIPREWDSGKGHSPHLQSQ